MKKAFLLAIAIIFISCNSNNFSKVKVGMTVKQVTDLVGEPKEKQELFGKWYIYDENIIVFFNDTVTKSMTKEELKQSMKEVNKGLKDLSN
jgi:outer membrane protein assembly factor BamE (lipoprotein component of BamABCDE complex)